MKGEEAEAEEASCIDMSNGRLHKEQTGILGSLLMMLERRPEDEINCAEVSGLGRS